ncbi:MAG: efflux RND transporter permease subunit, partial [Oscillospiraceae bacterium]|nr:efflux RND transporter permease subunit [Oscillospiraceae bacterium]
MFSLPDFSVRRPVCILICVVSLVLFGITSVLGMSMESTPEMNMPVIMVMTRYEGASPEEVNSMVTDVESALSAVTGVESMTST